MEEQPDGAWVNEEIEFVGDLTSLRIHVEGTKYHASVPGEFARGLWEYQEAIYKAAAFAITGQDDIRKLTTAQREELELVFEIRSGSTEALAAVGDFMKALAKGITTMNPALRAKVIIAIFLIAACGFGAWKALEVSGETKKAEVMAAQVVQIEQERTRQFETLAKVANKEPIVQRFEKAAEDGAKAVVRSASDATSIQIGQTKFDRDDIQEISQRAPRTAPTAESVTLSFRVFSSETKHAELSKFTLSGPGTGEFVASFDESTLSQDDLFRIMRAAATRTEIPLEVTITKSRGSIKSAQITGVP